MGVGGRGRSVQTSGRYNLVLLLHNHTYPLRGKDTELVMLHACDHVLVAFLVSVNLEGALALAVAATAAAGAHPFARSGLERLCRFRVLHPECRL